MKVGEVTPIMTAGFYCKDNSAAATFYHLHPAFLQRVLKAELGIQEFKLCSNYKIFSDCNRHVFAFMMVNIYCEISAELALVSLLW